MNTIPQLAMSGKSQMGVGGAEALHRCMVESLHRTERAACCGLREF